MSLIYLLDTNTISEPLKAFPSETVIEKIESNSSHIALSSISIYELIRGTSLLPDSAKRLKIFDYIESVLTGFPVVSYDLAAAKWHAEESARLQQQGKTPPFVDAQIAATAKVNNLVLVTRNVEDFKNFADLSIENWFY